jgi:hypothetical protein
MRNLQEQVKKGLILGKYVVGYYIKARYITAHYVYHNNVKVYGKARARHTRNYIERKCELLNSVITIATTQPKTSSYQQHTVDILRQ